MEPRHIYLLLACLLAFLAVRCDRPASRTSFPIPQDLSLESVDGVALAATLYPAATDKAPCLVLVHGEGGSRAEWAVFAQRAQQRGYACAAVDVRGHGESVTRGGERLSYRSFDMRDWTAAVRDIAAAKDALLAHGGDPDNVAVVGASIGANLALLYALADPDVQAVVMVSPGLNYNGIETADVMARYERRPVLLVTSKGDSYSASSCGSLKKLAPGFSELREYAGAYHGTDIFVARPLSTEQVLLWLDSIIGCEAASAGQGEGPASPSGTP